VCSSDLTAPVTFDTTPILDASDLVGQPPAARGSGLSQAPGCAPEDLCHPAGPALARGRASQDQRHAAVGGGSGRTAALEGSEACSSGRMACASVACSCSRVKADGAAVAVKASALRRGGGPCNGSDVAGAAAPAPPVARSVPPSSSAASKAPLAAASSSAE
jgi:hypothetical protein